MKRILSAMTVGAAVMAGALAPASADGAGARAGLSPAFPQCAALFRDGWFPLPVIQALFVHLDVLAAVYMHFGTIDVAGSLRTQIVNRVGNFVGLSKTAKRNVIDHPFRTRREDRRINFSRGD